MSQANIALCRAIMECPNLDQKEVDVCDFVNKVKNYKYLSGDKVVKKLHGSEVTRAYFEHTNFSSPVLVEQPDGLGQVVPSDLGVSDIERCLDPSRVIYVIDVATQKEFPMPIKEWMAYFQSQNREKVLNTINIEFRGTELEKLITAPTAVREMDWIRLYWPQELPADSPCQRPSIGKYCLMTTKGSFTDFHYDVGGTSVWHYVHIGEKIFYLIPPTDDNLSKHLSWLSGKESFQVFFGDLVPECYEVHLTAGNSFFLPGGWIHAVYTPKDSIVFQENFLHNFFIGHQLRLYTSKITDYNADCYPYPVEICTWYAAQGLLKEFKEHQKNGTVPPEYLLEGVKEMIEYLKIWIVDKKELKPHLSLAPQGQKPETVIDELCDLISFYNKA